MPLTLRLVFHTFRSVLSAGLLALTAWVALAEATPAERNALGARIDEERPAGLVPMRIARAMVHFAPDYAARMVARSSNGEISELYAGMLLRDLAAGPVARQEALDRIVVEDESTPTLREAGDAKFISVD